MKFPLSQDDNTPRQSRFPPAVGGMEHKHTVRQSIEAALDRPVWRLAHESTAEVENMIALDDTP